MENKEDWIDINYNVIPREIFDKYRCSPFKIMKRKMRNSEGKVWGNIHYFDARRECEKIGYRLPKLQEMLVLLDWYKKQNKKVSCHDQEFLGIKELSYDEGVCCEWIEMSKSLSFFRGGCRYDNADAGCFTLYLYNAPSSTITYLGFRCCQ